MDRQLIELYKQLEEMSNQYTTHPTDTTHRCVCDIQSRIIDILNNKGQDDALRHRPHSNSRNHGNSTKAN